MSSPSPGDPWQHLAAADDTPPIGHVTPADEYRLGQRIERLRIQERINAGVFAFFAIHAVSCVVCCLGIGVAAGIDNENYSIPVAVMIVALGWIISMAAAIHVAWTAAVNWQRLRWTWLLYASVPWMILCFEVLVVLFPLLLAVTAW